MKASTLLLSLTIALATLPVPAAHAQAVITSPGAMTYTGVVFDINPTSQEIVLKSEVSPEPVTYTYTPQTVFLDTTGKMVPSQTMRNLPVTVEYFSDGGKTIVRRVIASEKIQVVEGTN